MGFMGRKVTSKEGSELHATCGWKNFRSAPGGVVHKSIGENRPALVQSFAQSSPTEQCRTVYEYRVGRNAPDLRLGGRKCTSSRKIVPRKVPTERCTRCHNLCEYGSLRCNRHSEGGTRVTRTHSFDQ
ncbi:hypothetical protein TNCV_4946171 [Trichonephila clavipes]|nr:hypothetical protein TNCV_4946171 [Trichonephila clavipes]